MVFFFITCWLSENSITRRSKMPCYFLRIRHVPNISAYLSLNVMYLIYCFFLSLVFRCLCETSAATTQETSVSTPPNNTSSDSTTGHSVSVTLNPLSTETTNHSEPFTSVETPTATFSPVTTSSPSTLNRYIVSNSSGAVCIVMIADIIFHIKYNATEENNVSI